MKSQLGCLLAFALISTLCSSSKAAEDTQRETRVISGWNVHINKQLLAGTNAPITERAMTVLKKQLEQVVALVPEKAVRELKKVQLWVSPEYPGYDPTSEFHPSGDWLSSAGRDPAMAEGVEFTDTPVFPTEAKRMPNFVLHELAHAYHFRVVEDGFDNAEIDAAYEKARASGTYDKVERQDADGNKRVEQHYGMTSAQEYFAESSEAFFGRNDFFPYDREQLKKHDPTMYALLAKLWGVELSPSAPASGKPQAN